MKAHNRFTCSTCAKNFEIPSFKLTCPWCGSKRYVDHFHDRDTRTDKEIFQDFLESGFQ